MSVRPFPHVIPTTTRAKFRRTVLIVTVSSLAAVGVATAASLALRPHATRAAATTPAASDGQAVSHGGSFIDHSVVRSLAITEEADSTGASIAAYER